MLRTFILAGGKGSRIKEHTTKIPKPMINANGVPLFIHIINLYKKYGVTDVIILSGYKTESFIDYCEKNYSVLDKKNNIFKFDNQLTLRILNTGEESMTGGRISQAIEEYQDKEFYLTYGDGISNVNIQDLYTYHKEKKVLATLTAVRPPARFGSLEIKEEKVVSFGEKLQTYEGWINGGFFVIKREIQDYIKDVTTVFEREPLEKLAKSSNLAAFKHTDFWQPVDTIRDLEILEEILSKNKVN